MGKIITVKFGDSFIDELAEHLDEQYLRQGIDLSRLAIVFPGKRPALFLKRQMARSKGASYLPPRFFTIDEFMGFTVSQQEAFHGAQDLDQCYLLFQLAAKSAPQILKGREDFSAFLPWARKIQEFIDLLDLENTPNSKLLHIEESARIGYAVPTDVNDLLQNIVALRAAYHKVLRKQGSYSRGYQYLRAAELVDKSPFDEFDQIFFCNFFYLHRTEEAVIKNLYEKNKAVLFLQGDERCWPVFKRISKNFGCRVTEGEEPQLPRFELKLYCGFDVHSQVCQVREILRSSKDPAKTVVVLPNTDHLIPLLSEITAEVKDLNVSMGYPLRRSALYSLIEFIFGAQLSREKHGYYTRDYLKVLRHPLVKNLDFGHGPGLTRVLIHKIEEILAGQEKAEVSGAVFLDPEELFKTPELYSLCLKTLESMKIAATKEDLTSAMTQIHEVVFQAWESMSSFFQFSGALEKFLGVFVEKSPLDKYPLNTKIAARLLNIVEEMRSVAFSQEHFPLVDIFKIASAKMEREMVSFSGSPLKGLQVLGLFETRALNFENVIIMDTNEGVLPHLNIYEPLIPREVMISLNLDRLEQEEEIQRYQFMRLISSAKNVHLVYQESRDKEKSRFVEELIWEAQKKAGRLDAVSVIRPSFEVQVVPRRREVKKTDAMVRFLKSYRFSASSINTYLRNPIEFYESYVLGLREKENLLEEPENRQVGLFVHKLLEETFSIFLDKKPKVDKKFLGLFKKKFEEHFTRTFGKALRPDSFLLRSVLEERLSRFLDNEAEDPERDVGKILFIEKRFEDKIPLSSGETSFVYQMDRIDEMTDGSILIIDYKTGSVDPMPKGIERIEAMDLSRENIRDQVKSFQIPLYFYYLDKHYPGQAINAAFYNLRTLEINKFLDSRMSFDRQLINQAFLRALDFIVQEIRDPKVNFVEDSV